MSTYAFSEAFLAVFDRLPHIVTAVSRQRVVQISKRKTINNNIMYMLKCTLYSLSLRFLNTVAVSCTF